MNHHVELCDVVDENGRDVPGQVPVPIEVAMDVLRALGPGHRAHRVSDGVMVAWMPRAGKLRRRHQDGPDAAPLGVEVDDRTNESETTG